MTESTRDLEMSESESKAALRLALGKAGVNLGASWFESLVIAIRRTEETLVGPVSPEESPIVTVDLGREHVHWIATVGVPSWWDGRKNRSLFVLDRELHVDESFGNEKSAYVVVQDSVDGFICWIWQAGKDGVLRIGSPHLERVAELLETEAVRIASSRRGPRAAG